MLDDAEKERLLQQHEGRMHNITGMLDNEKKKQEHELDRALKERLDRRHRMREKQHGKDIRNEEQLVEANAAEDLERKRVEQKERLEKEYADQHKEIVENSDMTLQRQQLEALEQLTDDKKKQQLLDLEEEHQNDIIAKKAAIQEKYMSGQNEEDLQRELKKLLNDSQNVDNLLTHAESEKSQQEARLEERLRKRQKAKEVELKEQASKFEQELESQDLVTLHDREVVATEAHLRLKQKAKEQDGNDGTIPTGCVGIDKQGMPITDVKEVVAADIARKEATERKEAMNEANFKLNQEIDTSLQQKSLMTELSATDASLALLLKQQEDRQAEKLEARRAQIKARRMAKIKDEQEEKIVISKVETKEEEQIEKRKISEDYVRKLFKNAKKGESQEQRDKRLEILNEYLSDQYLDELASLLAKQYLESDAMLKKTMHKYMEESLAEVSAIKTHYRIDYASLEQLKEHMSDEKYNATLKNLKLNE